MRSLKLTLAIIAVIFLITINQYEATRVLDEEEEQWMKRGQNVLLQSLQRRPVRPPSPNGCTWVPGSGGRPCTATVSQQNFAGHVTASPPPPHAAAFDPYPEQMLQFGVATDSK
ncbi:hypothetical protein BUALT_Bualt13G0017900 [Buddleja alternifolia]|uniref:Uncharacterized protein n=1 Tax=Buddleja alternifolia TaxID=168488 RepID=A0AAV6WJ58_9LAMI|nr:hypothetical protein BUALT_Bualt13G0017900 [Buddleja alternifolia]